MTQLKHIVTALASLALIPSISLARSYTSNDIGLAIMNLNTATLKGKVSSSKDLWSRMRKDFRMTEVNPEIIRKQEQFYASRNAYLNRMIERSQPYLYHIVAEAEKRQVPAEVALLPFIESAFVTDARSPVGASGLWQFMPASGRQYGLEQTNLYDGRHDVYAATDAALNYLQYLYGLFGDWSLAFAAYNWGEGNVSKAIKRAQLSGIEPTYENLRLPNETRNYVPKLLAIRNIIDNPQAFDVSLVSVPNKSYFEAVDIDQPIDINAAAQLANISVAEFLALNPSFKSPVFIPKPNRKMLLPVSAVNTFERNYSQADKNSLLSWNVYKISSPTSIVDLAALTGMNVAEIKRLNNLKSNIIPGGRSLLLSKNTLQANLLASATVQSDAPSFGDPINQLMTSVSVQPASTVISAAVRTKPAVSEASKNDKLALQASFNELQSASPEDLQAAAARSVQMALADEKINVNPVRSVKETVGKHKVVKGDTLFSIAQRYHVNVADLITANKLRGNNIHAGQVLNVALNSDVSKKANLLASDQRSKKVRVLPASYVIKKGDTLSSIAQQFNIPVKKLQKVHGSKNLKPGQKIKLTNL